MAPVHSSDHLVANSHLPDAGLRELASGVDALYLSGRAELPKRFLARLEDCRTWAAEAKRPAPCPIGDLIFGIAPPRVGKYRFCLDHEIARIGFSTSGHLPTVRVQPRSQFLHAVGPEEAVRVVHQLLDAEVRRLRLWVNRVDLFADWQGWSLRLEDARRFVCRADARRTYEVAGTLTGFEFGSRKTNTFLARLYDKTADLAAKDSGWWPEVWGARYVPGGPVLRLEFEIGRQGLVEFDLNTPTEEQAAEGFSIAGQADKLRVYAELHDLGEVTVIADPGLSGKNLERPGLQQLLHMVDEGHVANVLTWRLDRLSRNLSDLILLADRFGQANVALHSFTEKIDLSSATGRMFYNILGSFAQFYREQLAENVRMGMQQAVRQGKWVNRPKTGYALVDGELVANEMAPVVRRIFTLRTEGQSIGKIADVTGVKYSTVLTILNSRIYLGEVQMNGEWFPGRH